MSKKTKAVASDTAERPDITPWVASRDGVSDDGTTRVRKGYIFKKEAVDVERRTVLATISTGAVDRQGDTVDPLGWELERYAQNPVVLWAHDYRSLPIGRASNVRIVGKGKEAKLQATARFETFPFADAVFNLIVSGTINATSVGFIPLEWEFAPESEERGFFAMDITKAELLEYSIVPVPANAEALIGAKGLEPKHRLALYEWADEAVQEGHDIGGLDKDQLSQVRDAWGLKTSHFLGGQETLDLAKSNIQKLTIDNGSGAPATVYIGGSSPLTISLNPTPEPISEVPKFITPEASLDIHTRLRRLRLDSIRRKDSSLH